MADAYRPLGPPSIFLVLNRSTYITEGAVHGQSIFSKDDPRTDYADEEPKDDRGHDPRRSVYPPCRKARKIAGNHWAGEN